MAGKVRGGKALGKGAGNRGPSRMCLHNYAPSNVDLLLAQASCCNNIYTGGAHQPSGNDKLGTGNVIPHPQWNHLSASPIDECTLCGKLPSISRMTRSAPDAPPYPNRSCNHRTHAQAVPEAFPLLFLQHLPPRPFQPRFHDFWHLSLLCHPAVHAARARALPN